MLPKYRAVQSAGIMIGQMIANTTQFEKRFLQDNFWHKICKRTKGVAAKSESKIR